MLTKSVFVHRILDLLQSGFQAHQAALMDMVDSLIQKLGRWHSAAFLRYIRTPNALAPFVSHSSLICSLICHYSVAYNFEICDF